MANSNDARGVWIKAFWDFNPAQFGFLGFTRQRDRDRLIEEYRPGDVVLIYGASTGKTKKQDRGMVLGILEIQPKKIMDRDRMSGDSYAEKLKSGRENRWRYAVPVSRAWKIEPRAPIKELAPFTYDIRASQDIATRGRRLTAREAKRVWSLRRISTAVFAGKRGNRAREKKRFQVSKGLEPMIGSKLIEYKDSGRFLYLMRWNGRADGLLLPQYVRRGRVVVKIGMAKNPNARTAGLNSNLPEAAYGWQLVDQSAQFPNARLTKLAEDDLKRSFDEMFNTIGREFFLCPQKVEAFFKRQAVRLHRKHR